VGYVHFLAAFTAPLATTPGFRSPQVLLNALVPPVRTRLSGGISANASR
jgi:hypothetical protein